MAGKIAIVVLVMSALFYSGVHSEGVKITSINHSDFTEKQGEAAKIICAINVAQKICVFNSPSGTPYGVIEGAKYEKDRIKGLITTNPNECGLEIQNIEEKDNGEWTCTLTGLGPDDGNLESASGKIRVVVANPPTDLYLEKEGERVTDRVQMNLDSGKQTTVNCVTSGARPAPKFIWYIGNDKLNANTEVIEENGLVKSSLEYNADPIHNGQQLKCEIEHMGYTTQALADSENEVSAELDLTFKPEPAPKPEVFYNQKIGAVQTVMIKFKANPAPTEGTWKIGETEVAVGGDQGSFKSSSFQVGDVEGDHTVQLTFTMTEDLARKPYTLQVKNALGEQTYAFELASSKIPEPADSSKSSPTANENIDKGGATVVGIVVVVVVIIIIAGITIFARAKSILCFKAKARSDDDAERAVDKEGSDTESAEDTTATKDEAKPEEEAKKDDKKAAGPTVVARMSNLFAAVKKSVKKPKENKYTAETPESEMKLHDNEEKKEGDDQVLYADLDKSALGSGTNAPADGESTEYAEIRPQN